MAQLECVVKFRTVHKMTLAKEWCQPKLIRDDFDAGPCPRGSSDLFMTQSQFSPFSLYIGNLDWVDTVLVEMGTSPEHGPA